ncbi:putative 2OG-Fe(II) oxygenase [Synechococcus phage S-MS29]|nr:putative 2OG-Fe(II) oxygenase [Synechococcus phage S-MS29]
MIIDLFPTSVYVDNLSLTDTEREYLLSVPMNRNADDEAWVSDLLNTSTQYHSIAAAIKKHVDKYAYDVMNLSREYNFHCHGAWLNKNDKGDKTSKHHHSNSLISGVYYIDVDPHTQGGIEFHDDNDGPFGKFFTVLKYTENNHRNSHRVSLGCQTGMIMLFPSVLKHSVSVNQSDKPRLSLAFDYMLTGMYDAKVNRFEYVPAEESGTDR